MTFGHGFWLPTTTNDCQNVPEYGSFYPQKLPNIVLSRRQQRFESSTRFNSFLIKPIGYEFTSTIFSTKADPVIAASRLDNLLVCFGVLFAQSERYFSSLRRYKTPELIHAGSVPVVDSSRP